jgi:GH15 family glucan-1,4-alpha-glucosidase
MSASFVRFPEVARHGVIGDRYTGALVAADGTLDWFCAPSFDGSPIFGALLDPECGGFCRFGPPAPVLGRQRYLDDTAVLLTEWVEEKIELADVMVWPGDKLPQAGYGQRVILRRIRVTGSTALRFELQPGREGFRVPEKLQQSKNGAILNFKEGSLRVWTSFDLNVEPGGVAATFGTEEGKEYWVMLGWNSPPEEWSANLADELFSRAEAYWREWSAGLQIEPVGSRTPRLRRSAITVQLLSSAEHDSAVAALTTSLPERLGGDRNYDYRFAWVRDASLSLALLARMGRVAEVRKYLDWLWRLRSTTNALLQPCYRLDGNPHLEEENVANVRGYEDSLPVRRGNLAAKQLQLGSLGFFADCARVYLEHGGEWREEFWQLLKAAADFTCEHWQEADSGVWELSQEAHYVASRVMCWVVLERAAFIAEKSGCAQETDHWRETAAAIHREVMEKGWCEEKNSFRQRYGSDALDAAALLIPLMGFLPIGHPRVLGTLAAIERELVVDGLVHRFVPSETLGGEQLPIGKFEGAFLPCVFWHAHALAKAGRNDEAEAILEKCEAISGETGLFAEEIDAAQNTFLGNTPLLFAHVEYVRAVMALHESRTRLSQFHTHQRL